MSCSHNILLHIIPLVQTRSPNSPILKLGTQHSQNSGHCFPVKGPIKAFEKLTNMFCHFSPKGYKLAYTHMYCYHNIGLGLSFGVITFAQIAHIII